jgi:DNA helicase MCM8
MCKEMPVVWINRAEDMKRMESRGEEMHKGSQTKKNCVQNENVDVSIFKDLEAVREIHDVGEDLFKLLVASLSPAIYGHDLVKAGLLLGLFGGSQSAKQRKGCSLLLLLLLLFI